MDDIKVGDEVTLSDYSYCRTINKGGELGSTGHSIYSPKEKIVVVAIGCILPTGSKYGKAVLANDTILVEVDTKRVLFTHSRFVQPRTIKFLRCPDIIERYEHELDSFLYAWSGVDMACSAKQSQEQTDQIVDKMLKEISEETSQPMRAKRVDELRTFVAAVENMKSNKEK